MKDKSKITIEVEIDAPRNIVGKYVDDLSLITSFHPKVRKVEYSSGKRFREKGVKYRCIIPKGNKEWSCIEEVTEYEKNKRMVTVTSGGTLELEKLLGEFTSELLLSDLENNKTQLTLKNYYKPIGIKGNIVNLFFKWKFKKQFLDTFIGLKKLIERENGINDKQ